MVGQFSKLERKSIEPTALNVEDGNVRLMQRFISDPGRNGDKLLDKYHNRVNEDIGKANRVLIFDETGFIENDNQSLNFRLLV